MLKNFIKNIIELFEADKKEVYYIGYYPLILKHHDIFKKSSIKNKQGKFELIMNCNLAYLQKFFKKFETIQDFQYAKIIDIKDNRVIIEYHIVKEEIPEKIYRFAIYYKDDKNFVNYFRKYMTFTIKAILLNKKGLINYVDNSYHKKINAFNDIEKKTINTIGNSKEIFEESPIKMMECLRLCAETGYDINKAILKVISNNIKLLKTEDLVNIINEFNKIFYSYYPSRAFILLKELGFTNLEINDIRPFQFLNDIPNEHFYTIDCLVQSKNGQLSSIEELWTQLLLPIQNIDKIKSILTNFNLLKDYQENIIWLINNYDIIKFDNVREKIYEASRNIPIEKGPCYLNKLIMYISNIHNKLNPDNELQCQKLIDSVCSRPYFKNQILFKDEEICRLAQRDLKDQLDNIKENIILELVKYNHHPNEKEYENIVMNCINKTI